MLLWSCGDTKTGGGVAINNGSMTAQQAVDQGIQRAITKARCQGYSSFDTSRLKIEIVTGDDAVLSPIGQVPSIRRPCGNYCGTEWDDGTGHILVGGYHKPDGDRDKLVLPYIQGHEADLSLAAEYESEHWILRHNDQDKYQMTAVHGQGQGHPLIPNCP